MRTIPFFLLIGLSAAAAQPAAPTADAEAIQRFAERAAPTCQSAPAQTCIDQAWRFAVADPSEGLALGDVQALRRGIGQWYDRYQEELPVRDRGAIGLGMVLADGIGLQRLHGAFDADRDGLVTQEELLADVTLDERPLGRVLADPKAVDRPALARRLGLPLAVLEGLFPR